MPSSLSGLRKATLILLFLTLVVSVSIPIPVHAADLTFEFPTGAKLEIFYDSSVPSNVRDVISNTLNQYLPRAAEIFWIPTVNAMVVIKYNASLPRGFVSGNVIDGICVTFNQWMVNEPSIIIHEFVHVLSRTVNAPSPGWEESWAEAVPMILGIYQPDANPRTSYLRGGIDYGAANYFCGDVYEGYPPWLKLYVIDNQIFRKVNAARAASPNKSINTTLVVKNAISLSTIDGYPIDEWLNLYGLYDSNPKGIYFLADGIAIFDPNFNQDMISLDLSLIIKVDLSNNIEYISPTTFECKVSDAKTGEVLYQDTAVLTTNDVPFGIKRGTFYKYIKPVPTLNVWIKASGGGYEKEFQMIMPVHTENDGMKTIYLVDYKGQLVPANGEVLINGMSFPIVDGVAQLKVDWTGIYDADIRASWDGYQDKHFKISNMVFYGKMAYDLPFCIMPKPSITLTKPSVLIEGQPAHLEVHITPETNDGLVNISYWDWDKSEFVNLALGQPQNGIFAIDWTPPHNGLYSFWVSWHNEGSDPLEARYELRVESSTITTSTTTTASTTTIQTTTSSAATTQITTTSTQTSQITTTATSQTSTTQTLTTSSSTMTTTTQTTSHTESIQSFTASIQASASVVNIQQGGQLSVTVTTNPPIQDLDVSIEVSRDKQNWQVWANGKTGIDGKYTVILSFTEQGTFYIRAKWNGGETAPTWVVATASSPCIIATVAYGSPMAPEVAYMRHVRDNLIGSTEIGGRLVKAWNAFYYSWSPVIANFAAKSEALKALLRALLLPLVGIIHLTATVFWLMKPISPSLASVLAFTLTAILCIVVYVLIPICVLRKGRKNLIKILF